ncbi:hypothetical protein RUMCAL_03034 [Ruminococcus callidus ATCC 27760]|uniref:Uncharacterized protein n=1 Tax=Ruminococcus callidus ATCC 27760 TaxID=411473 RepID=U2K9S4_9FIRM|nr:hypothetical protein RUMCAL_03034 [Ruminococcus callidus ATCC 27760]
MFPTDSHISVQCFSIIPYFPSNCKPTFDTFLLFAGKTNL